MLSDVSAKPAVEPMMTERKPRKPAPMKGRKDIGEVEFPIEKLMKFRDASASCVHKQTSSRPESTSALPPTPDIP